jgi:hypothetical protein
MKIQDIITEDQQVMDEFSSIMMLDEFSTMARGIRKALEKKGYRALGAGVDQEAYLEPNGQTVLKIFGTQGNTKKLSADQKMFAKWADFCQRNSDNPFLPKFSGWETFNFKGELYLQIRTEFLKPSGELGYAISLLGRRLDNGYSNYYSLEKDLPREYNRVVKAVGEQNVPLLLNTLLELIHKTQKKKDYNWDLHAGNIMMRPNGQPVLNDPYVLGTDSW